MLAYYTRINVAKEVQKAVRKRDRDLIKSAQALAWYHEQQTGIRVDTIPIPSDVSQFTQSGITLDRGNLGKYWSSSTELVAREKICSECRN